MNREERKSIWKEIVETFCKSTNMVKYFCLEKGDDEKYCEADSEKYRNLLRSMDRFYISNRILKSLNINWEHKSIIEELKKGEESEIFYNDEIILSNFGVHNEEIPYEILKKMDIDIKKSSNGCAYWALKNVNEEMFRNRYSELVGKQPYVLFKTTTSDNSGGKKMLSLIDSSMDENEINRIDKEKKQKNMPDLMHSYKNEEGKWVALPNELTYITIPVNSTLEGVGVKAVAFVIEKFYICQENFELNCSCGQQGTYPITKDAFKDIDFERDAEETQYIIAKLKSPYIVEVSNIPNLQLYLSGRFNMEEKNDAIPRIVFQVKGRGKNAVIESAFAFREESQDKKNIKRVYVCDFVGKNLDSVKNFSTDELYQEIKNHGEKGIYTILNENNNDKEYNVIDIVCGREKHIKMYLNMDNDCKQARAINGDNYKYYWFEDDVNENTYAFRYENIYRGEIYFDTVKRKYNIPFVLDSI